ncbi:DUF421 domain-containing protein [Rubripirellula amarantea]|nr:DUF421 domain-containing protein [Rubripirellula amarantea]
MVLISSASVYVAILLYTRFAGLRSFSKMSAPDFAMTVAVGSLFGSTISSPSPTLVLGLVALASLYFGQWIISALRQKFEGFGKVIDNQPLLLMAGREFLDDNLRQAKVTRSDVYGKLREANALNYDEVLAVVFETTGDISVLHRSDSNAVLEQDFIKNVIGNEHLQRTA